MKPYRRYLSVVLFAAGVAFLPTAAGENDPPD